MIQEKKLKSSILWDVVELKMPGGQLWKGLNLDPSVLVPIIAQDLGLEYDYSFVVYKGGTSNKGVDYSNFGWKYLDKKVKPNLVKSTSGKETRIILNKLAKIFGFGPRPLLNYTLGSWESTGNLRWREEKNNAKPSAIYTTLYFADIAKKLEDEDEERG